MTVNSNNSLLKRWVMNWARWTRPLVDWLFGPWLIPVSDSSTWAKDIHYAQLGQEPLRARALLRITAVIFVVLIGWASVAKIDEVTRGEARVVPSRQLQVIQSLDGGIVSELRVHEGQIVNPGHVLIRIDATRFESTLRENRAQFLVLLAKSQRLAAIAEGREFVVPPEVLTEAPEVAAQEQRLYESSKNELNAQISIGKQQLTQREEELSEASALLQQTTRGYDLASRELNQTAPLVESGAVSEVEVLRLRREVSQLRGDREQAASKVKQTQAAIYEAKSKLEQIELDYRNKVRNELTDTTSTLNSLAAGSVGLSDKVKQTEVKSPVRGTIKRLLVNTVGGVVLPGRDIVEIVPLDDTLLLEAKITPRDIAFLRPGQHAKVKFTAYDYVIYGGLDGVLESIGADSITDDKGNSFYIVRVRTDRSELGPNLPIIPGMMAQVDIMTGRKSILSYLMKPVLRAKQMAFSER